MAVVAVRLRDCGLKSGEEGVLRLSQDVAPHAPAAAVEALLVNDDLALLHKAAEGVDVVGEHLGCCAEGQGDLDRGQSTAFNFYTTKKSFVFCFGFLSFCVLFWGFVFCSYAVAASASSGSSQAEVAAS